MAEFDVIVSGDRGTRRFRVAADDAETAGRLAGAEYGGRTNVTILPAIEGDERGIASGEVVEIGS